MVWSIPKRNTLFLILIMVSLCSSITSIEEYTLADQNIETRAVWLNHYAFNSDAKRNETLEKIRSANLNTVLMISPPIGDNNGWSEIEDFSEMLEELVEYDISVHAWIANLYRVKGQRADFSNTTEQSEQINWALEILRTYPKLDGVHFDYIRTENLDYVNATKMNAISSVIEHTKERIREEFPEKYLTTAGWSLSGEIRTPQDELPEWYLEWFNQYEDDPVNRWSKAAYSHNGHPTCFGVQQDPVIWLSQGELDFHISMEYCYETDWWTGEVDIWNTFPYEVVEHIFMGLGWYSGVWEEESYTEEMVATEIVNKIQYGRSHKITGFSIFELGEPYNNDSILISKLAGDENDPFWNKAISGFKAESHSPIDLFQENIFPIALIGIISLVVVYAIKRKRK
ncbi:MAG: hypothetical protein BAJATHORv1_10601 [Candidatus Thorarchaeota archaeon]|nr:MAG: hypothetical protein BAJATHORv1_10601 [Candidatus Thorarchaeota archaeon]